MKNPVVIIQARMGSTRLPGKTMMKIGNRPLIHWAIKAASAFKNVNDVIVATTDLPEDDDFFKKVEKRGVKCMRGSAENVLNRFYTVASKVDADPIVRLCADSPLIAVEYMERMLKEHIENDADLTHNISAMPRGSVHEVISFSALMKMHESASQKNQREHVTPYIHENPNEFKIHKTEAPKNLRGGYRLTIDTEKDLEMMRRLFDEIQNAGMEVNLVNALTILSKQPDIPSVGNGR